MYAALSIRVGVGLLACAAILLIGPGSTRAQEGNPKMFKFEFKVFPANDPTGNQLDPFEVATIHYRNKVVDLPDIKFDLKVNRPKPDDARKFYWVEVQEGWLIDNLVIRVKGAVNPAVVTRLVTRDNMVLYPGASDSGEDFKFPAYMGQMGTYRSLFREFVEEAAAETREFRRSQLLLAFKPQLENMSNVRKRLPRTSEVEIAAATKLKDEVIRLYFGLPDVAQVQECPQLLYYYPSRTCGLFGRFRSR